MSRGVQCKKKFEKAVTEKELEEEVAKALKFKPAISEFILTTTAPRDQAIQEKARLISERLGKTDHPISVVVWGWEDRGRRHGISRDQSSNATPRAAFRRAHAGSHPRDRRDSAYASGDSTFRPPAPYGGRRPPGPHPSRRSVTKRAVGASTDSPARIRRTAQLQSRPHRVFGECRPAIPRSTEKCGKALRGTELT